MKIAVLVKQVPDTWADRRLDLTTGRVDRDATPAVIDEICEYAVEVALQAREQHGGEVVAITMGRPAAGEILRRALEMGADEAVLVTDPALEGADLATTAAVLTAAIRDLGADLIVAGTESTDGRGGIIPAMIAEHLGLPYLEALDQVELTPDAVQGTRSSAGAVQRVRTGLPAVISTTERASTPRVPGLRDVMRARKKKAVERSLADLGLDVVEPATSVVEATERPARAAGPRVPFSPDAVREVVDLLADRHLI